MEREKDPLVDLLIRIQDGDETALAELYDAVVNRVYGLAIKIVLKPELAEEVVGDVFMQVWKKAKDFDASRAVPLAWMLMICRSRALDTLRRERPQINNNSCEFDANRSEDESTETSFTKVHGIDVESRVYEALQLLTDKQRQAIFLAFYKDMTQSEISEYTGDPIGTVKSNIRRAQLILKETLSREDLRNGGIYEKA